MRGSFLFIGSLTQKARAALLDARTWTIVPPTPQAARA